MAANKKLPDTDVLLRHVREGMNNKEIGELYGTSGEAVRQQLAAAGVRQGGGRPDHSHYLPWKIRADHVSDVLARRLRAYSKRQQGKPLSATDERLLNEFMQYMDGANPYGLPASVHYDRTDDEGFWIEPRRPGDRDYISPPV
ncbi:MAG: hypothetical protein ACXVXO_11875 [Mycobacteriaceae bacterium]